MGRWLRGGVVVLVVVLGASPAGAMGHPPSDAVKWLVSATTIAGFNLGLVQQPNAQFVPSTRPECKVFTDATMNAAKVTGSFAYQRWLGGPSEFEDSVRVFKKMKGAVTYFKPYKNAAWVKSCLAASFTPPVGSGTTVQVSVQRQKLKLHDVRDVSLYLIDATYTTQNRAPRQIEAQSLVVRYKQGIIDAFVGTAPGQFNDAARGVIQAVKADLAAIG